MSKLGATCAGLYALVAVYLIATQGLFGESFIAIVLGMPWTLFLALIEFGGAEGFLSYVLIIIPMLLNALVLYWFGALLGGLFSKQTT